MKLLVEQYDVENFDILEEGKESKSLYIKGPFIQMDTLNGNNRIYPSEYIAPKIEEYITTKVAGNRAVGELNHPSHPDVNYERAAIKIVELKRDGKNYIGKAKVLENLPMGSIVAGLIREGVQMTVSSRALGSVKRDAKGVNIVQPDFRLMTAADIVSDPSAPDAFVQAIMEGKEWAYVNGMLVEKDAKKIVDQNRQNLGEAMQELIKMILAK